MLTDSLKECIKKLPINLGNEIDEFRILCEEVIRNTKILLEPCSLTMRCSNCPFCDHFNSEGQCCGYGDETEYREIALECIKLLSINQEDIKTVAHVGDIITWGDSNNIGKVTSIYRIIDSTDLDVKSHIYYEVQVLTKGGYASISSYRVKESELLEIYKKSTGFKED